MARPFAPGLASPLGLPNAHYKSPGKSPSGRSTSNLKKEYFSLEKDGIPIVGIMGADELEDYLEVGDPKVRDHIRKSSEEYRAGKGRPTEGLLAEFGAKTPSRPRRSKAKRT